MRFACCVVEIIMAHTYYIYSKRGDIFVDISFQISRPRTKRYTSYSQGSIGCTMISYGTKSLIQLST